MCIILNVIMLIAYGVELNFDYDIILDSGKPRKTRGKYIARLIVDSVLMFIVLWIIYKSFGLNDENLGHYIKYGKVI